MMFTFCLHDWKFNPVLGVRVFIETIVPIYIHEGKDYYFLRSDHLATLEMLKTKNVEKQCSSLLENVTNFKFTLKPKIFSPLHEIPLQNPLHLNGNDQNLKFL